MHAPYVHHTHARDILTHTNTHLYTDVSHLHTSACTPHTHKHPTNIYSAHVCSCTCTHLTYIPHYTLHTCICPTQAHTLPTRHHTSPAPPLTPGKALAQRGLAPTAQGRRAPQHTQLQGPRMARLSLPVPWAAADTGVFGPGTPTGHILAPASCILQGPY